MIERPNYVRIVNTDKMKVQGRFNGEDYEFLPNKPNDVPVQVAAHIFGFGHTDKTSALNRLGWLNLSDHLEKALDRLQKIVFSEAPPLIEASMPEPESLFTGERMPGSPAAVPALSPGASGDGRVGGTRPPALPKPR